MEEVDARSAGIATIRLLLDCPPVVGLCGIRIFRAGSGCPRRDISQLVYPEQGSILQVCGQRLHAE